MAWHCPEIFRGIEGAIHCTTVASNLQNSEMLKSVIFDIFERLSKTISVPFILTEQIFFFLRAEIDNKNLFEIPYR